MCNRALACSHRLLVSGGGVSSILDGALGLRDALLVQTHVLGSLDWQVDSRLLLFGHLVLTLSIVVTIRGLVELHLELLLLWGVGRLSHTWRSEVAEWLVWLLMVVVVVHHLVVLVHAIGGEHGWSNHVVLHVLCR